MNDTPSLGYLGERKSFLRVLTNYLSKITELKQKNKELHHITETQKRIISILAHDVRNPLASIKNIIELKQSAILDANDAAKMMDMVTGQLNNTIEMVDNIVNWGQLHLQHRNLQLEYFDLNLLVERIFGSEMLKSIAKNNKLINQIPQEAIICSDERALEFILRNLISNSNKYTENGSIMVDIEQTGIKTIFSVTDTGVGIPVEMINELLNNNTCQSTLGTNKEKGNGLGLMLVKEFLSRLEGSIRIESTLNKGTKFMIEI
ncbi:MAG: divJ 2 [Mucilaginibacter sp.]|nr:divJ 2 [Mucilaginibacter sp.]